MTLKLSNPIEEYSHLDLLLSCICHDTHSLLFKRVLSWTSWQHALLDSTFFISIVIPIFIPLPASPALHQINISDPQGSVPESHPPTHTFLLRMGNIHSLGFMY
jgi:hypothetical protein